MSLYVSFYICWYLWCLIRRVTNQWISKNGNCTFAVIDQDAKVFVSALGDLSDCFDISELTKVILFFDWSLAVAIGVHSIAIELILLIASM